VATIDGSPKVAGFYSSGIVRKNIQNINAIFGLFVHPRVVDTWEKNGGKPYWCTPMIDPLTGPDGKTNPHTITFFLWNLSKNKVIMAGMGNVGSFLWNVAYSIEADPIILVGFDFSEQVQDKSQAIYFDSYANMFMQKYAPDEAQDKAAALHQLEINPDFIAREDGEGWQKEYFQKGQPVRYLTNPTWKVYRKKLAQHISTAGRLTINATGNGCLHTEAIEKDEKGVDQYILKTPNFKCADLEDVLSKYN
jgi:hypothetical protein